MKENFSFKKIKENVKGKVKSIDKRRWIQGILVAIILVCLILLGRYYYQLGIQNHKTKKIKEVAYTTETQTEEKKVEYPKQTEIDFNALHQQNPDIYAWLKIPGTNVDYPVLRSNDDKEEDFYLDHNVDLSSGYPGCIYTQKRNNPDFSDPNTIFYGHNMRNKSMFATLHRFEDRAFFDGNKTVYLYTPDYKMTYQIFAAYPTTSELILDKYGDFRDKGVFVNYLQEILSKDGKVGNIDASAAPNLNENSRILTFSTCINDPNRRYLVQAYLVDDGHGNQFIKN